MGRVSDLIFTGFDRSALIRFAQKLFLFFLLASVLPIVALRGLSPPITAFMVYGEIQAAMAGEGGYDLQYRWVDLDAIAPEAALAVVAAEDQLFNRHFGFDLDAMEQAMRENETGKRIRGASTLSQQTAKNLFLYPAQSYFRKALEAWLTLLLELILPKQRILEIYLNIAQFGRGIYGVEAASQAFFSKPATRLSTTEAALLAAVLPNPIRLQVEHPSPYVLGRQAWILKQMRQLGGVAYLHAEAKGD